MKIDKLLNKYFEGETSCEEEYKLRRFFTEEQVPEELQMYRPLFTCLAEEVKVHQDLQKSAEAKNKKSTYFSPRRLYYIFGGIAAGMLLCIGIGNVYQQILAPPTDYVIINGKQYTDANLIREQALSAFQDVSMSQDEVLDLMFE